MPQDVLGFPVTTDSAEAAGHFGRALASFNDWRTDAMDHLGAALAADPEMPFAHAFKGLFLVGGRSVAYRGGIDGALAKAKAGIAQVDARERLYIEALEHAAANRLAETAAAYEAIIDRHPTDLLAHRLVQQEYFWNGEAAKMRAVAERAAPAWNEALPGHSLFLSVRSFSNEEALHYADAERFGRQAIEIDPTDAWGAHAIAHVLLMQGRLADGIAWLEPLTDNWAGKNQIVHHLWWHFCLFLLEQGAHDRVLAFYDEQIRNPESPLVQAVPDAYIDLQNVASLLARLEMRGVDVGDRWSKVADVAEGRIDNDVHPFTSAHAAMILAGAGRFDRADALIQSMTAFAETDQGRLGHAMAAAAIPGARAAVAHRRGDHAQVVDLLMAARHDFPLMGGSHAQRDIFYQLLADSLIRLGRADRLGEILKDVETIGFENVGERTLYRDAAAMAH